MPPGRISVLPPVSTDGGQDPGFLPVTEVPAGRGPPGVGEADPGAFCVRLGNGGGMLVVRSAPLVHRRSSVTLSFPRPCRDSTQPMKPFFRARPDPTVLLVALLVVVNVLAVLGMVRARRDARIAVRDALVLETRADARAFEARLAREHAQLEFLARSPTLGRPSPDEEGDPVARRWARLDLEATLLVYLQSSPAVVRLRVREGEVIWALAQRVDGIPTLTKPRKVLPLELDLLHASWPLDEGEPGRLLEAWLDPEPLTADIGTHLRLHRRQPAVPIGPLEPVSSKHWMPPLHGWVERSESDTRVLGAVERLATLYRVTFVVNVALLPVTLLLGALTVRRVRRLTSLESERRQQAQLRALELQVQHAERLAILGRFAAGMAHEINNPLEGMANYLQLLREDLATGRPDEARQWLPRLAEGIDRVARTVRQVLHFGEPGSTQNEQLDLARVLERTVDFLGGHPDCQDVSLRLHGPDELVLEGDPVSLEQLVLNLVLNACQSQGGGEVEILASGHPDHLEVAVLDRGPGFAPEVLENLFEPFQSTRGSSGLGLAVCHGIVMRHQGQIEVRERLPGPGSEVRVRLPRHLESEEES